jgi:Zn-dependent protease
LCFARGGFHPLFHALRRQFAFGDLRELFERLERPCGHAHPHAAEADRLEVDLLVALRGDVRVAARVAAVGALAGQNIDAGHMSGGTIPQNATFGKTPLARYHLPMLSTLFQNPLFFAVWIVAILFALTVHEFSHALVGTLLGDPTAKRLGRLTLNPVAHIDPFGLLTLVAVGFGWGKPVPFNPYNLRDQRWGPVAIALAGPGMNLLVATIAGIALRILLPILGDANLLVQFLLVSIYLNMGLLLFNLIPIPPLDGSKLLFALLRGPDAARQRMMLETRGPWVLFALVIGDMVFNVGIFSWLFGLISSFIRLLVGV